jgi:hypothetical protein
MDIMEGNDPSPLFLNRTVYDDALVGRCLRRLSISNISLVVTLCLSLQRLDSRVSPQRAVHACRREIRRIPPRLFQETRFIIFVNLWNDRIYLQRLLHALIKPYRHAAVPIILMLPYHEDLVRVGSLTDDFLCEWAFDFDMGLTLMRDMYERRSPT